MEYVTLAQVKRHNQAIGHHWFESGTMRFFRSRVSETVYPGGYFVTSEQGPDGVRRYSVRQCVDGSISTVGEFQAYRTAAQAHRAAQMESDAAQAFAAAGRQGFTG